MARILYAVHGTGHGHAMRGLTIARAMPQHEFLFVANDDAPKVLEAEFRVERLPNLGTVFRDYRVAIKATVARAIPLLLNQKKYIAQGVKLIESFAPDLCITDLEYFIPRAAQMAGVPCLTLDHQHIITCCRHELPKDLLWDAFLQGLTPRWLFRPTKANVLISFYAPPIKKEWNAKVFPPILREKVLRAKPRDDGHILVYQSNSTDRRLIDFLKTSTGRKAYVYGYGRDEGRDGNVFFRKRNEDEFLELLAGCSFVIQGGSHTLMGEALYLNKPVISIPIKAMVEQRFNALYLDRLGYGRQAEMARLDARFMADFEEAIPIFRQNQRESSFDGNQKVFDIVEACANSGQLPDFAANP